MSDLLAQLLECGTPARLVADVALLHARTESAELQLATRRANDALRKARSRANLAVAQAPSPDEAGHKRTSLSPSSPADAGSPRRGGVQATRLPDDFSVPEEWLDWGRAKRGWTRSDVANEAEYFCRYWQARGRDASRRCWRRTWQNWVCNSRRPGTATTAANKPAFEEVGQWNCFCDAQAASLRAIGRERAALEWERRRKPAGGGLA